MKIVSVCDSSVISLCILFVAGASSRWLDIAVILDCSELVSEFFVQFLLVVSSDLLESKSTEIYYFQRLYFERFFAVSIGIELLDFFTMSQIDLALAASARFRKTVLLIMLCWI